MIDRHEYALSCDSQCNADFGDTVGNLSIVAKIKSLAILTGLLLSAGPGMAADQFSDDAVASAFPEARWGVTVGGFAGFAPAYEGSDEYRFVGYPLIIPKYYGDNYDALEASRVTFKGIDDVRITALRFGQLDLGPVVGYSFGRDEDDADLLTGLGDIDGGFNVGGFAALRLAPFYVDAAYVTQITGDTDLGHTIRIGAGWEDEITERLTGRAYLSTVYASDDYMDAHFSISPAQAAASVAGLPVFDAESGFKNVSLEIGGEYKLTERWSVNSKLGYSRLLSDASDSPVTASKNQFSGGLGLTYTFGRTR
ncbi:MipA/OmpV family protein [Mesorhizobium sp. CAU 1741]|uniref:MipA/OmpV family protein n=1 Tax=Mesorhizobium sp. CAU 1741 TaxID=3140366 RepID=UPI00325C32B1